MDLDGNIETIAGAFEVLGGIPGLRELTGCKESAIRMWKHNGSFPANQTHTIEKALAHRGYSILPEVLGQKSQKSNSEGL